MMWCGKQHSFFFLQGVNWTNWPVDLISFWWWTLTCKEDDYQFQ